MTELAIGFILGNAFCYFFLAVPIMKLDKKYQEKLEKRIKELS